MSTKNAHCACFRNRRLRSTSKCIFWSVPKSAFWLPSRSMSAMAPRATLVRTNSIWSRFRYAWPRSTRIWSAKAASRKRRQGTRSALDASRLFPERSSCLRPLHALYLSARIGPHDREVSAHSLSPSVLSPSSLPYAARWSKKQSPSAFRLRMSLSASPHRSTASTPDKQLSSLPEQSKLRSPTPASLSAPSSFIKIPSPTRCPAMLSSRRRHRRAKTGTSGRNCARRHGRTGSPGPRRAVLFDERSRVFGCLSARSNYRIAKFCGFSPSSPQAAL